MTDQRQHAHAHTHAHDHAPAFGEPTLDEVRAPGIARIGIGGPVGSGKTALIEALVPTLVAKGHRPLVVTNALLNVRVRLSPPDSTNTTSASGKLRVSSPTAARFMLGSSRTAVCGQEPVST